MECIGPRRKQLGGWFRVKSNVRLPFGRDLENSRAVALDPNFDPGEPCVQLLEESPGSRPV